VVVLALPDRSRGPGPLLAKLREREQGELEFELAIAPLWGPPRPAARLRLGARLPPASTERLDFDPCSNSGSGLQPAGLLNRLRGPSYSASQEGRTEAYATHRQDGGPTDAAAGSGPRKATDHP
jgi:hypothetical protein